jgi:subtilisin family serine protease
MPSPRLRFFAASTAVALLAAFGLAQLPSASADVKPGRYIVHTLSVARTDHAVTQVNRSRSTRISARYNRVFHGFAAQLTANQVRTLRADPGVVSVVPDHVIRIDGSQAEPSWGLDRIDQHARPLSGSYSYQTTGSGVTVFEIDTGIRLTHEEFGGRASSGYDWVDSDTDASDCNGHGTHVAGTIGGRTFGVAKEVNLVALRVLDCDGGGWESDFEAALEYVVQHHSAGPAVVNISAGGLADGAFDDSVNAVVTAGVPVVVAAGNSKQNACNYSPAGATAAITVAASTSTDSRATDYSNYGGCVDVFAPGDDVLSAYGTGDTATDLLSGTSMAAPHVAGAVARYLQAYPKASPSAVHTALVGDSTKNVISSAGTDSPNRLLYVRRGTTAAPRSATTTRSSAKRTLKLTWKAPYGFGSPKVTGYRVTRSGTDISGKAFAPVLLSAAARSYTFGHLKRSKAYSVTVLAMNSAGASAAAKKSIKKI